jgi:hypothetical protein
MSSKLNPSYIARASLVVQGVACCSYHVNIWIGRRPHSLSTPPKHFHHSSSLALRKQDYIAALQDPSFRHEEHQSRLNSFTLANCIKDQPKLRVIQSLISSWWKYLLPRHSYHVTLVYIASRKRMRCIIALINTFYS